MGAVSPETEKLFVLVHGKGDNLSSWAEGFAHELESSVLAEGEQVVTVDWEEYSHDLFRSTLNGRRIGHDLGRKLSGYGNIRQLHLIGHSAGSFVAYGICEAMKKANKEVFIHATYLDPVAIYGGVDWNYGSRNFGRCADISDAYIDHEDNVPGSNGPLKHPHTFDVTGLKKQAGYSGSPHLWPIVYYRRAVQDKTLPYWTPDETTLERFPPGKFTVM